MDDELLRILTRIAIALESIAYHLGNKSISSSLFKETEELIRTTSKTQDKSENVKDKELENNFFKISDQNDLEQKDMSPIERYLKTKNITIKNVPPEDGADEVLDNLATLLGEKFSLIKPFYEKAKETFSSALPSFSMSLKNYPPESISAICQFAQSLHELAFLEDYIYKKSPNYIIYAKPNKIPKAINFFTGHWLERFVKIEVIKLIQQVNPNLKFSYLKNPQVKLPNGLDFEFDILFEIEGEIYWFEAKTGDYQRYIEKYSNIAKILKLDTDHVYVILLELPDSVAKSLKNLFNINILRIDDFPSAFLSAISKYSIPKPLESEE